MSNQLDDEMRAGAEASQLWQSKAFQGAFDSCKEQLIRQLEQVGYTDQNAQARLVLALQMLKAVRANIEQTIQTGEMARIQLEKPGPIRRLFGT